MSAADKKSEPQDKMMDDGITELLTNVVTQLQTVQENIQSCHETSITLDSGVDTSERLGVETGVSDRLEQVDTDLESLIREIKELTSTQELGEPKIMNSDNTSSIMENISLALSSLELNVNSRDILSRGDGIISPAQSEDDSLERMVDQLFRNVRSLKSILVESPQTDGPASEQNVTSDDSDQLSKLIEFMSNSNRSHNMSETDEKDEREGGEDELWDIPDDGRKTYDSHGNFHSNTEEENSPSEDYSEDYSDKTGTEYEETEEETEETETSTSMSSDTDTQGGRSSSTSLEYGFIPLNYTLIGTISQCATPSRSGSDSNGDGSQVISIPRMLRSTSEEEVGEEAEEPREFEIGILSEDDSLLITTETSLSFPSDDPYGNLQRLPEFPVPLKRNRKDLIDMYNLIKTDLSSISKIIEPESLSESAPVGTYSGTGQESSLESSEVRKAVGFTGPKLISDSSDQKETNTSNKSRDAILSDLKNEAETIQRKIGEYEEHVVEREILPETIISESLEFDDKTDDEIDKEFLEMMRSVKRVNKHIDRLKNDPKQNLMLSPGEIPPEEAEWDDFTPQIDTPKITVNYPPENIADMSPNGEDVNMLGAPVIMCEVNSLTAIPSAVDFPEIVLSTHQIQEHELTPGSSFKPSSSEADNEVRMITQQYPDSDTSSTHYVSDPDHWPLRHHLEMSKGRDIPKQDKKSPPKSKKRLELLDSSESEKVPSLDDLIQNARASNSQSSSHKNVKKVSTESHSLNSTQEKTPKHKQVNADDIPSFLRLFIKPGEKMEDLVPNTALLNALLASSGLTITPIVEKVNAGHNTSLAEAITDHTSQVSSISEEEQKPPPSSTSSRSVKWTIGTGRPPKLESLTKSDPVAVKSVGNSTDSPVKGSKSPPSRSLSEAMGSKSTLSEHSANSLKQTILLNKKPAGKAGPLPKELYNVPQPVPPVKVLTFDTWTCTEPAPQREDRSVETNTVQTEDRALSPIKVLEYPKLKKLKKIKHAKAVQPEVFIAPPAIVIPTFQGPPRWDLLGNLEPDSPDPLLPMFPEESEPPSRTDSGTTKLPPIEEEESSSEESETGSEATESSGILLRVKGRPSARKQQLEKDLNKALLDALHGTLHGTPRMPPEALRGLKTQLERQTSELVAARQRLVNAGSRVRNMAQMFSIERSSASPLEDNM